MISKVTNRQERTARAIVGATLAVVGMTFVSGCHIDMWRQAKIKPYWQSDFFADEQGSRPLVPGTVSRGSIRSEDPVYFTGKVEGGKLVKTIPVRAVQAFASPKDMLLRGQSRFNAYCSPCHGKAGNGNGFISQRGLGYWQKLPASFHTARLRKIEDGHLYDTLVNGYGIMYGYGSRIQDVNDRWATVAYIRALQVANGGINYNGGGASPLPETTISGSSARDTGEGSGMNEPAASADKAGTLPSGGSSKSTQRAPATSAGTGEADAIGRAGSVPERANNVPAGGPGPLDGAAKVDTVPSRAPGARTNAPSAMPGGNR